MTFTPGAYLHDGVPAMLFNCGLINDRMIVLDHNQQFHVVHKADMEEADWKKLPIDSFTVKGARTLTHPGQPVTKQYLSLTSGHVLDESLNIYAAKAWLSKNQVKPAYVTVTEVEELTIRFH